MGGRVRSITLGKAGAGGPLPRVAWPALTTGAPSGHHALKPHCHGPRNCWLPSPNNLRTTCRTTPLCKPIVALELDKLPNNPVQPPYNPPEQRPEQPPAFRHPQGGGQATRFPEANGDIKASKYKRDNTQTRTYIHMCAYMCIYNTHTHTHTHIYIYIYNISLSIYIYICVNIYIYIHMFICRLVGATKMMAKTIFNIFAMF